MAEKRTKPMLIGDLLSWQLDKDWEVIDQADYEAWCHASLNWSFGDSHVDAVTSGEGGK